MYQSAIISPMCVLDCWRYCERALVPMMEEIFSSMGEYLLWSERASFHAAASTASWRSFCSVVSAAPRSFSTNVLFSCLTDKIQEAQKELKDPKGSQKGEIFLTEAADFTLSLS